MLITLLPLLKGWEYIPKDIDKPFTVPAKKEKIVAEERKPGWLNHLVFTMNNPDAELVIRYGYPLTKEADMRPKGLYQLGLTTPPGSGINYYTPCYDDTAKVYSIAFFPNPYLPYGERGVVSIRATEEPALVYNYSHLLIRIADMEVFLKSLQRVIGFPIIAERLREILRVAPATPETKLSSMESLREKRSE